jgi:hypothetical protein
MYIIVVTYENSDEFNSTQTLGYFSNLQEVYEYIDNVFNFDEFLKYQSEVYFTISTIELDTQVEISKTILKRTLDSQSTVIDDR